MGVEMSEVVGRWTRQGGNHRFLKSATKPNLGWVGMVQRTSPDHVAERWEWFANRFAEVDGLAAFQPLGSGTAGTLEQAFRCVEAILRVYEVDFERRGAGGTREATV
jgi:hypothetical protein